ncbi:MAG TPA: bifunctional adenosylcobinamide kinase/adenosylcobinamide-phosphate guanylyltransferase [Acidimicrobiales bacterium]|nr:bifunctional adenosylcobinamide kinase/adenosylcobinamide-phosphate guanylyltransferase [Acidimicrobiales bacterium]
MISLVMGGARSGKSGVAERLALRRSRDLGASAITYLATGVRGLDPDFDARIAVHRARRGDGWRTVEVGLGGSLSEALGCEEVVLVDSLGTWLAGRPGYAADEAALLASLEQRRRAARPSILVSDEATLGVHPETEDGRRFRDALGGLNTAVAALADEVLLVVAGRVLVLPTEEAWSAMGDA